MLIIDLLHLLFFTYARVTIINCLFIYHFLSHDSTYILQTCSLYPLRFFQINFLFIQFLFPSLQRFFSIAHFLF